MREEIVLIVTEVMEIALDQDVKIDYSYDILEKHFGCYRDRPTRCC